MCFVITGEGITVSRTFAEVYRGLSQTLPWNTEMSLLQEYSVVSSHFFRKTHWSYFLLLSTDSGTDKVPADIAARGVDLVVRGTPERTLFVLGFVNWFLIYLDTAVPGIPIFRCEDIFQYLVGTPGYLLTDSHCATWEWSAYWHCHCPLTVDKHADSKYLNEVE